MKTRLPAIAREEDAPNLVAAIVELTEQDSAEHLADQESHRTISGVVIGRLVAMRNGGEPLVDFPGNTCASALSARSVVSLQMSDVGCEILLSFENGEPEKPVVTGIMNDDNLQKRRPLEMTVDEDNVVFTAQKEITLRCGKASITLTRAGKVLIRGAYLLSRSSGVNRIKGGSVQIN